jgi:hypothetical protein
MVGKKFMINVGKQCPMICLKTIVKAHCSRLAYPWPEGNRGQDIVNTTVGVEIRHTWSMMFMDVIHICLLDEASKLRGCYGIVGVHEKYN